MLPTEHDGVLLGEKIFQDEIAAFALTLQLVVPPVKSLKARVLVNTVKLEINFTLTSRSSALVFNRDLKNISVLSCINYIVIFSVLHANVAEIFSLLKTMEVHI